MIDQALQTVQERDACAIIAFTDKRGKATHANIIRTIEALKRMAHRSGDINDEADGCGITVDIPRELWSRRLHRAGLSPHLADSSGFFAGHIILPHRIRGQSEQIFQKVSQIFSKRGMEIILDLKENTNDEELGPMARMETPLFWQICGLASRRSGLSPDRQLFEVQMEMESEIPDLHVASLSVHSVVYKVRGGPELLQRVFPDLRDTAAGSRICLGHSRYSTNTLPTVERTQPFSVLAHNGEINTIERLRSASQNLGVPPVPGGSDSQDLNRVIEGLIHKYGFDPLEAFAMVFPAVYSQVAGYSRELQEVYESYRWFFQPSAQGPAAIVARYKDICLGSVDALGLRPLWFGESDYNYYLSSEKGVVDLEDTAIDPRPLAPGEKTAIISIQGKRAQVLDYHEYQKQLLRLAALRKEPLKQVKNLYHFIPDHNEKQFTLRDMLDRAHERIPPGEMVQDSYLAALGWLKYDVDIRKKTAMAGRAVIGSMGYQGPLACFNGQALPNLSEYFKENVAVVTNPAIDREREADHFSTRSILGDRPDAFAPNVPRSVGLELRTPLLLGGCLDEIVCASALRDLAREFGTQSIDDVLAFFTGHGRDRGRVAMLDAVYDPDEGLENRLKDLCGQAGQAVKDKAVILVLDDSAGFRQGRVFIDPLLCLAYLGNFLEEHNLRRRCSLIVRSAAVRNLHDVMCLLGLGADAINPYMIWRMARVHATSERPAEKVIKTTMDVLQKGMEKVMSTMGIHELCGYGRIFSTIGLSGEVSRIFRCPNFCGAPGIGLTMAAIEESGRQRLARADSAQSGLWKTPARNARVGRILRRAATGVAGFREMAQELGALEKDNPVALRHALDFVPSPDHPPLAMNDVDISIKNHSMPLVIPAMSFGSQGENSFR
ncbi:MAG: glutamate synthase central domain-containing protein, partial [Desulfonatronovibrionaceae bacterium]